MFLTTMFRVIVLVALAAVCAAQCAPTFGARQHALTEQIKSLTEQYNRDFDAFVKNELEAWWAVAGDLVKGVCKTIDGRGFYEAHDAELDAIRQQHGLRFFHLMEWLAESVTSHCELPLKLRNQWYYTERVGVCKGDLVCRGTLENGTKKWNVMHKI